MTIKHMAEARNNYGTGHCPLQKLIWTLNMGLFSDLKSKKCKTPGFLDR